MRKSWNTRGKQSGPTKAGYWCTVPVSSEFYWYLVHNCGIENMKPDAYLLPRHWEWDQGQQAAILRGFCIANKLASVKFHTLRACFAGIDEGGATEVLRFIPTEEAVMEKVASMYEHRKKD